jgi:hypothetical protein
MFSALLISYFLILFLLDFIIALDSTFVDAAFSCNCVLLHIAIWDNMMAP